MKTYGKVTGMVAAIAALAVSGIALADHNPGHSKKKDEKDPPGSPGSKFSIEVDNHCIPDPDNNALTVKSKITNESEDTVVVKYVQVTGLQLVPDQYSDEKKPKQIWDTVGAVKMDSMPEIEILEGGFDVYEHTIYLCGTSDELQPEATALNVEVQVMIEGRNFVGNCDDQDIDENPEDGIDDADESRIDFDDPQYEWLQDLAGC
jgi:hypothetical protein